MQSLYIYTLNSPPFPTPRPHKFPLPLMLISSQAAWYHYDTFQALNAYFVADAVLDMLAYLILTIIQ